MKQLSKTKLLTLFLTFFVLFGSGTTPTSLRGQAVFAENDVPVAPLPDNNLIQNPWFRNGNKSSLDGWTDAAGNNVIWSTSQKRSNPTPDLVMGTSARLAFGSGQGGGTGQGDVDAYLYQVVQADPALNRLQFKIHWVTVWIDRAAVTIYGGTSADGPWTAVWTPLDINQDTSSAGAWTQTDLLDKTISQGFPFYKIELFGRYPEGWRQGVKYSGVYFSVDDNAGEVTELVATEPPPPPAAPVNEAEPTAETAVRPTRTPHTTPVPTNAPEEEAEPATAVAAVSTAEPTEPIVRSVQSTVISPQPTPPDNDNTPIPLNDSISSVYLVIIGVLLLLVIVLGIGWARAARR